MHDLSEREANSVVSQLSTARLDARKVQQPDGRWAISVDQDEMLQALSFIETRRVLPTRDAKVVASKGAIIPSREEQWFRYERSVALSIEESLSALPGVLDARVHVNLPDDDPLFGDSARKGGSASVLLVVDRGFVIGDEEVAALVGGAAGLPHGVVRVLKSATAETQETRDGEVSTQNTSPVSGSSLPHTQLHQEPFSPATWRVVILMCASLGVVALGVRGVARFMKRRPQRKVTFALPRELDCEG